MLKHTILLVPEEEGGYSVEVPALPGCYTQGETFEEAIENIKDAINLNIEDRLANNEPITDSEIVSLSSI